MYCPYCKSKRKMFKKGFAYGGKGERKQRYQCYNCGKMTINPLRSKL